MSSKKLKSNNTDTQSKSIDIRDLIKRAQSQKPKIESKDEQNDKEEEEEESDHPIIYDSELYDMTLKITNAQLNEEKHGQTEFQGQLDETLPDKDEIPLPRKKTELEKYLKSKERSEQIRKYNEDMIKETREQRAVQRAKSRIRQRSAELEEPNSNEDHDYNDALNDDDDNLSYKSPTKKVRFSFN